MERRITREIAALRLSTWLFASFVLLSTCWVCRFFEYFRVKHGGLVISQVFSTLFIELLGEANLLSCFGDGELGLLKKSLSAAVLLLKTRICLRVFTVAIALEAL